LIEAKMHEAQERELLTLVSGSMLEGQDGIKTRAFLAFNRGNELVTSENLEALKSKGLIVISDDTIYPVHNLE
jgi:hypothetical protein